MLGEEPREMIGDAGIERGEPPSGFGDLPDVVVKPRDHERRDLEMAARRVGEPLDGSANRQVLAPDKIVEVLGEALEIEVRRVDLRDELL